MRYVLAAVVVVAMLVACDQSADAGGGPENVLLVVNPSSESSQEIANYYTRWRHIPSSNVFETPWRGGVGETDGRSFREGILKPILETIEQRGLAEQIDYIVYSSDFPYAVDLRAEMGKSEARIHEGAPVGSLNSMTYLAEMALQQDPAIESLRANVYGIRPPLGDWPTRGFRHNQGWGDRGELAVGGGRRYYLSTMLAVTTEVGNSVDEALAYLRRSALADGTRPNGTIYFMTSSDARRSNPRDHRFPLAVKKLHELGVRAENLQGTLPEHKNDVQGAMIGAKTFDWAASGSKIRPGAICDHLTSYGGVLKVRKSQTTLTEFLRYGAAGACGTVWEPFNTPLKFPDPMIQVHYARGATLAEAFYHSIPAPFQQLIVGDPLCRPWAVIPTVELADISPGETLLGEVTLKPSAKVPEGYGIGEFRLFVDGRLADRKPPGKSFHLNTTALADGWHELRIVAIESSPIQSQGRLILPVMVDNQGRVCRLKSESGKRVSGNESIRLTASSPGSRGVLIYHNRRRVGQFAGEQGEVRIDPRDLGPGPVRLFAIGLGDGNQRHVVSPPIDLEVDRWKPPVRTGP